MGQDEQGDESWAWGVYDFAIIFVTSEMELCRPSPGGYSRDGPSLDKPMLLVLMVFKIQT